MLSISKVKNKNMFYILVLQYISSIIKDLEFLAFLFVVYL